MAQRGSEASAAADTRHADLPSSTQSGKGGELQPLSDADSAASVSSMDGSVPTTKVSVPPVAPESASTTEVMPQPQAPDTTEAVDELTARIERLERRNTRGRLLIVLLFICTGYLAFDRVFPDGVVVQQKLMESTEVKLVDTDGNARLFLRMFSRVPVLQILGEGGTPRMSLGLRFDNTPFIDLSDRKGQTRATFEMTSDDTPVIQFYDANGEKTTRLN